MDTLLLIIFPLFAVALFVLRILSRRTAVKQIPSFPERRTFDGLFAEQREQEAIALQKAEAELRKEQHRLELLARAYSGDESCLDDAHATGDRDLYDEILDAFVAAADGDFETLRSISEYIVDSGGLRSTRGFSAIMIEQYSGQGSKKIDQRTLADMLYLSALSDTAEIFERAIGKARESYRLNRIRGRAPRDFLAIVEHAYWLLSAEVRYSGSGFILKQLIAEVRRELAAGTRLSA